MAIMQTGVVSEHVHNKGAINESYIAASYVKFIESAGARVAPILYPILKLMFLKANSKHHKYTELYMSVYTLRLVLNSSGDLYSHV